jgi:hypothetical protein
MVLTQLYAALSVYTRDARGVVLGSEPGSIYLHTIVTAVADEEERHYPGQAFPYDGTGFPHKKALEALPTNLAKSIVDGSRSPADVLAILNTANIRHEWTVKPGKRLYAYLVRTLPQALRSAVCGRGGLRERLEHHADMIEIAKDLALILLHLFDREKIYYPIVATVAVIATNRGLAEICRPGESFSI